MYRAERCFLAHIKNYKKQSMLKACIKFLVETKTLLGTFGTVLQQQCITQYGVFSVCIAAYNRLQLNDKVAMFELFPTVLIVPQVVFKWTACIDFNSRYSSFYHLNWI